MAFLPGVMDNIMNVNLSLRRDFEDFLSPTIDYGQPIPEISPELRARTLLCLDEEVDQLGTQVQDASIIVVLQPGSTDPALSRERFRGKTKGIRLLGMELWFKQSTPMFDRYVVQNRITLNMLPDANLRFWDTKNTKDTGQWDEITPWLIDTFAAGEGRQSDSGFFIKTFSFVLYYFVK